MNYADWYTDRLTVRRVIPAKSGALTVQRRETVAENIPCRIYRSSPNPPRTGLAAASMESVEKLACANEADIRAGDELLIRRGGALGRTGPEMRALAGEPVRFYEPFGAVIPGLAHQEIALLEKEYI